MRHWTKFLPEAGTIRHWGNDQENRALIIKEQESKLELLKANYSECENELFELVLKDWTKEEIREAKQKSEQKTG